MIPEEKVIFNGKPVPEWVQNLLAVPIVFVIGIELGIIVLFLMKYVFHLHAGGSL
jgi:hypothetical protein